MGCLIDLVIVIENLNVESFVQAVTAATMVKLVGIVCVFDIVVLQNLFHLCTSGVVTLVLYILKREVLHADTKLKLLGVLTALTADKNAMAHRYYLHPIGMMSQ